MKEDEKELITRATGGPAKNAEHADPAPGVAPDAASAPSHSAEVAELTATIQRLQAEKKELYDRLLLKSGVLEVIELRSKADLMRVF
jgi:hypothetical protein